MDRPANSLESDYYQTSGGCDISTKRSHYAQGPKEICLVARRAD